MYWMHSPSLLLLILVNLKFGSGFPDNDLCLYGQDNPLIAAYCQKIGIRTETGVDFDRGDTWTPYEDKRASEAAAADDAATDEYVPYAEADEDSVVDSVVEKRKLGDSLRLGKRQPAAFMVDGVPKFGRQARLFEQMRLGKRAESADRPPRDKKKSSNGKRLQLVDTIRMGKRASLSDSLRIGKKMALSDSLRMGKRIPLADSLRMGKRMALADSLRMGKRMALSDSLRMGKRMALSDSLRMGKRMALSDSLRMGKRMALSDSLRMGKREIPLCSSVQLAKRLSLGESLRVGKRALADSMRLGKRMALSDSLRMGKRLSLGDSLRVGKREYPEAEWLDCIPDDFVLEEINEIREEELEDASDDLESEMLTSSPEMPPRSSPETEEREIVKRSLLDKTLRLG